MAIRHFAFAFAACLVAAVRFIAYDAPVALFDSIATGLRWLAAPLLGDVSAPRFDEPYTDDLRQPGQPLDSALLNSLRHEAGMRPLRC